MNIRPIGENILVKPDKISETTKGGIFLAEKVKDRPEYGEVVALGTEDFNVKVGDRVIFKKYAPDEVEIDEEKYLVMTEDAILAVIN